MIHNQIAPRNPTQLAVRSKIDELQHTMEEAITKGEMEQTIANCKEDNSQAKHYFGDGVYARSLLIPAGTAVVGHIHKQNRVCIISQGKCTFVDEWHKRTVTAPWIGEFKAGSKTAVYAHTDTTWIACLGTDLTDPDIIVEDLLKESHDDQVYIEQLED